MLTELWSWGVCSSITRNAVHDDVLSLYPLVVLVAAAVLGLC
jgi:hypothetical protein